jgi:hypothetical protein
MYVVTNRRIYERREGLDVFGSTPNDEGPNELRLVKVTRQGAGYAIEPIKDKPLTRSELKDLKERFRLDLDASIEWYPSLRVACELMEQAAREKRHLLIVVHGYNNDMRDVLDTAEALEAQYNVIVVPFSWPANGGGKISGTAAYLDDKRDARASMDALNRFLGKVHLYHLKLTEARRDDLWKKAKGEVGGSGNLMAVQERFSQLLAEDCEVTLNLMCHSMGNYVLKYALRPSSSDAAKLIFDNISLVAADTNNEAHEVWAERLQVRNRLFVFINENDFALDWSRRKPGDEQGVRLGHYLRNLVARNVRYIDVTHADGVGNAHGYFVGRPVTQNATLKAVFTDAFEGGRAEERLDYAADLNAYRLS